MRTKFDLKTSGALWTLKLIPPDDLPAVAIEAIEHGLNSDSLTKLASLTSDEIQEAVSLFQKSLEEIGLEKISKSKH